MTIKTTLSRLLSFDGVVTPSMIHVMTYILVAVSGFGGVLTLASAFVWHSFFLLGWGFLEAEFFVLCSMRIKQNTG
jgi:hypothetical protein